MKTDIIYIKETYPSEIKYKIGLKIIEIDLKQIAVAYDLMRAFFETGACVGKLEPIQKIDKNFLLREELELDDYLGGYYIEWITNDVPKNQDKSKNLFLELINLVLKSGVTYEKPIEFYKE